MKDGDICIHKVAQPDGTFKIRPVLLLKQMPPFGDWIVCAVSTQLRQEVKGFDFIIDDTNPGFMLSGLKGSSLIRLGFINTVDKKTIPGVIGEVSATIVKMLQQRLADKLIK
jgi:mRNA interferase MazF